MLKQSGGIADTIVFITGADRGIGYEVARNLSSPSQHDGYHVIIGSLSDEDGADAVARLLKEDPARSVTPQTIDVTSDESVQRAIDTIGRDFGRLDVLVNNAGVLLDGLDTTEIPRPLLEKTFSVNVFGAAAVTEAAIPLLESSTSPNPRIVFMSSRMGSLSVKTDSSDRSAMRHFPIYRSSKAALNMIMLHYSSLFRNRGWLVNACDPGLTATALAGNQKNLGSVEEDQASERTSVACRPSRWHLIPDDDDYDRGDNDVLMAFTPRISQRKPLSCTSCAKKKLRCSKSIPCTSCIDRGLESSCAREKVIVRKKHQRSSSIGEGSSHGTPSNTGPVSLASELSGSPITIDSLCDAASPEASKSQHPSAAVPDDAPVTLENLALGRQRILNMRFTGGALLNEPDDPAWLPPQIDFIVSLAQARVMLSYHTRHLAWIHNVLHMPTFAEEVENAFAQYVLKSRAWIALFYAFLCHTAYHGSESLLAAVDMLPQRAIVEQLYTKAIEALHTADFMAVHSLHAAQAISLLIQVGHNLGQSDFVFVLLSSTTRIAQSLDLNRLGPDTGPSKDPIGREIKKRLWWFLVKQDWMQIPYGNMFTINASHFNTPPPLNCFEDPVHMCGENGIKALDSNVLTQSSWAGIHNQIAILIYKTHEKMCRHGHPGNDPRKIRVLYDEVLSANAELQHLWHRRPDFFRMEAPLRPEWPSSVPHLRRLFAISFARAYFAIHRHFQLKSFRDDAYSVTRISCLAAARSSLRTFIEWPDDDESLIFKKMWTNNNNLVAAAVALLFGVLFSSEQADGIFEKMEMRQLLNDFLPCLSRVGTYSSVAKRGVDMISVILDYERAIAEGSKERLDIEEVVGHVKSSGVVGIAPSYADWTNAATQYDFMTMESWLDMPPP